MNISVSPDFHCGKTLRKITSSSLASRSSHLNLMLVDNAFHISRSLDCFKLGLCCSQISQHSSQKSCDVFENLFKAAAKEIMLEKAYVALIQAYEDLIKSHENYAKLVK